MDDCSWYRLAKVLCSKLCELVYSSKDTDLGVDRYVNISIYPMCTGSHYHPVLAFPSYHYLPDNESASSCLVGCGIQDSQRGLGGCAGAAVVLPDPALEQGSGGCQAEVCHFLHALKDRRPNCCEVARRCGLYTSIRVCNVHSNKPPQESPSRLSAAPRPALPHGLLVRRLEQTPAPSPGPGETALGRSRGHAAVCIWSWVGGGEKGECKCISIAVITFLTVYTVYTWALVPWVPWVKINSFSV